MSRWDDGFNFTTFELLCDSEDPCEALLSIVRGLRGRIGSSQIFRLLLALWKLPHGSGSQHGVYSKHGIAVSTEHGILTGSNAG